MRLMLTSLVMKFTDHFSRQSSLYRRFRPQYPEELYNLLSNLVRNHETAWDCATGNGQAAVALAARFKKVIATDASSEQIQHAMPCENVEYRVAPAEASGLDDASVDLVTVANAVHWFEIPAFYEEVRRVLRKDAVIAVWCYEAFTVDGAQSDAFQPLYDAIGDHWAPHLELVRNHYKTLEFPFQEFEIPKIEMALNWNLEQCLGFLASWSGVQTYKEKTGQDPTEFFYDQIQAKWGEPLQERKVSWQLHTRVGRNQ